jgi:hypothetical protein
MMDDLIRGAFIVLSWLGGRGVACRSKHLQSTIPMGLLALNKLVFSSSIAERL